MKDFQPHIGNLILAQVQKNGQKVSWLAKKVHCSRSNFYRILEKDDIGYHLLWKISDVLDYDFFLDISNKFNEFKAFQDEQSKILLQK